MHSVARLQTPVVPDDKHLLDSYGDTDGHIVKQNTDDKYGRFFLVTGLPTSALNRSFTGQSPTKYFIFPLIALVRVIHVSRSLQISHPFFN